MEDQDLKEKVLAGMMEFMDELEGEGLRKHPKLLAKASAIEAVPVEESLDEAAEEEVDPDLLAKLQELLK